MRELTLNGYIDEEEWYGDEITPASLHDSLYGAENQYADDVHIRLNSYGGSCNAAVRMFDDIRAYPGSVSITVSGTAASAATMLCMAADRLEITPGSLFMIHDPSMMTFGNEHDLLDSINLLRACKESILNMYERRVRMSRDDVADMMTASTWMDAKAAADHGFVDAVVENPVKYPTNSMMDRVIDAKTAEERVNAWIERKKNPHRSFNATELPGEKPDEPAAGMDTPAQESDETQAPEAKITESVSTCESGNTRVKVSSTDIRLNDLKY